MVSYMVPFFFCPFFFSLHCCTIVLHNYIYTYILAWLSSLLPDRGIIIQNTTCNAEISIALLIPSNIEKDPDRKPGLLWAIHFFWKFSSFSTKKTSFTVTGSFRFHAGFLMAKDRNGYLVICWLLKTLCFHTLRPKALVM